MNVAPASVGIGTNTTFERSFTGERSPVPCPTSRVGATTSFCVVVDCNMISGKLAHTNAAKAACGRDAPHKRAVAKMA